MIRISGDQRSRRQVIRKPGYQRKPEFYFPDIEIPWYPCLPAGQALPDNLIAR
jgi:hypothetical protein